MKKQLFWMIGAALALTSCSNDEQVAVNPVNEITFRTTVTRATEVKNIMQGDAEGAGFKVTAYFVHNDETSLHINDDIFKDEKSNGTYSGTTPHYWDVNDDAIVGQAWYPYVESTGAKLDDQASKSSSTSEYTFEYKFNVQSEIKNQVDFISANIDEKKNTSGLTATFEHNLSQVEIKAVLGEETPYSVKVKKVILGNVKIGSDDAKLTITGTKKDAAETAPFYTWTKKWTLDNNATGQYEMSTTDAVTLKKSSEEYTTSIMNDDKNQVLMLYPQDIKGWSSGTIDADATGTYIGLLVDIDHADGRPLYPEFASEEDRTDTGVAEGGYGWIYASVPNGTWESGKHYTYTLTFAPDAAGMTKDGTQVIGKGDLVTFTKVNVSDWEEGTSSDAGMDKRTE